MIPSQEVIKQTKKWIADVVIGCNFCPFAAKEFKQNTIHYVVETNTNLNRTLQCFIKECILLDNDESIMTILIVFPDAYQQFDKYLDLVSMVEELLAKEGYDGIYQVASFHPQYRFLGSDVDDAANYTNRSIYPMLHILREDSIEQALKKHQDPEGIPVRNVNFAREKGIIYMKMLWENCL